VAPIDRQLPSGQPPRCSTIGNQETPAAGRQPASHPERALRLRSAAPMCSWRRPCSWDRGVKRIRHKTKRSHGKKIRVKLTVYTANEVVRRTMRAHFRVC
jgi:hypothetical protein